MVGLRVAVKLVLKQEDFLAFKRAWVENCDFLAHPPQDIAETKLAAYTVGVRFAVSNYDKPAMSMDEINDISGYGNNWLSVHERTFSRRYQESPQRTPGRGLFHREGFPTSDGKDLNGQIVERG